MGEGENDVAIGNGQDILSAGGKQLIARPGVALWAMSVAAGSILDDLMRAVVARQDVRAERGGAARGDVTENPLLLGGQHMAPALEEFLAVLAEGIGNFELLVAHRCRALSWVLWMSCLCRASSE